MKKKTKLFIIPSLSLILIVSMLLVIKAKREKTWTIMLYVNGAAKGLHHNALYDFIQLGKSKIPANSKVKFVVQLAKENIEHPECYSCGDWSGIKRFEIDGDTFPFSLESTYDVSSSYFYHLEKKALEEFIEWGITNFKSDYYGLIFWDHGQLFHSNWNKEPDQRKKNIYFSKYLDYQKNYRTNHQIEFEKSLNSIQEKINLTSKSIKIFSNNSEQIDTLTYLKKLNNRLLAKQKCLLDLYNAGLDSLDNEIIRNSFNQNIFSKIPFENFEFNQFIEESKSLNNKNIDLKSVRLEFIAFDSCNMGFIELANNLIPLTKYLLASQTNVPAKGFNYEQLGNFLHNSTHSDPETFVSTIYQNIVDNHLGSNQLKNYAIIRTDCLIPLNDLISQWVTTATKLLSDEDFRNNLKKIKKRNELNRNQSEEGLDLFFFMEEVLNYLNGTNYNDLKETTESILGVRDNVIFRNKNFSKDRLSGLTIYDGRNSSSSIYLATFEFARITKWMEFINALNQ